jgi:hypothetical protein
MSSDVVENKLSALNAGLADTLQCTDIDCHVGAGEDARSVSSYCTGHVVLYTAADLSKTNCLWPGLERKQILLMLRDALRYDSDEGSRSCPPRLGPVRLELLFSLRMEPFCFCQALCLVCLR